MPVAGFILTGGASRRMGRDKALLPAGTSTLVERLAGELSQVAESVTLVGRPAAFAHLPLKTRGERFGGCGPLSGIHSALEARLAEWNLIVACDLPNLRAAWLRRLAAQARPDLDVVVSQQNDGRIEPLCALYHARCLPPVEKALVEGRFKLLDLILELKLDAVRLDDPTLLFNVNTPEEWSAVSGAVNTTR